MPGCVCSTSVFPLLLGINGNACVPEMAIPFPMFANSRISLTCRFVRKKDCDNDYQEKKLVGSRDHKNRKFDFDKLIEVTSTVTRNLNKVIDVNQYPVETARNSNLRHRPIGLGVQGLADTFILLGLPFDSPEAKQLNKCAFKRLVAFEDRCVCTLSLVPALADLQLLHQEETDCTAHTKIS
jgi:hypothetical protein